MEITANFYSDFIKLNLDMITELKNQGFRFEEYYDWKARKEGANIKITSLNKSDNQETVLRSAYEYDLVFEFSNWMERIPEPTPRKIHKCYSFSCPEKYQVGLSLLEKSILTGDNLLPYLSRDIYDAKKNDNMLYVLGITHFHLGEKQDEKRPLLIKGTKDILYSFIRDQDCYFIKIDKHGLWYDEDLLRLLYNDFPEVLKPWKLKDVSPSQLSDNDKKILRSKNVTTLITINNEAYIPPGWGTSTAGTSINARFKLDKFIRYLEILGKKLIILLKKQHIKMEKDFNKIINNITLSLIQTDPIKILDKENNLLITVNSFDDNDLSINITDNHSAAS